MSLPVFNFSIPFLSLAPVALLLHQEFLLRSAHRFCVTTGLVTVLGSVLVLLESLEELGIRGQHPSVFSVRVLHEELVLVEVVLLLRLSVPELLVLRLVHVLLRRFLVLYRRRVLDLRVLEGVVVFLSLLREA